MILSDELHHGLENKLKLQQFVLLKLLREHGPREIAALVSMSGLTDATVRREIKNLYSKQLIRRSKVPPIGGPIDRATLYSFRR